MTEPKSMPERAARAREQIASELDAWVCSATANGDAYVVPLTYEWDGSAMLFSTASSSRTVRDLERTGKTRIALGSTREVVILDGTIEFLDPIEHARSIDAFVAHHHWDPRLESKPFSFFFFRPRTIQAWRVSSELATRDVMRNGRWLDLDDETA